MRSLISATPRSSSTRGGIAVDLVDAQVTYPIVTALLGAPRVKTVRGMSDVVSSYVYVIFEDGTDIYWARSTACGPG